jgi:hypothetical protein
MPNRLALAGAVFIAIAELLGPQRASAPEAQSGRRYKNGDAAAQRFGSQRALRWIRIDLDGCGALNDAAPVLAKYLAAGLQPDLSVSASIVL